MVEFQPSKLAMRVRFPLPAPIMFEHRTCNKKSISKMVDFFLQNVGVILITRPSKRGRTSSPLHIVCIKLIPTTYNLWSKSHTSYELNSLSKNIIYKIFMNFNESI